MGISIPVILGLLICVGFVRHGLAAKSSSDFVATSGWARTDEEDDALGDPEQLDLVSE